MEQLNVAVLYGNGFEIDANEQAYNLSTATAVHTSLKQLGYNSKLCPINQENGVFSYEFDWCFNLCDGDIGTSSCPVKTTRLLESLEKYFTGNTSECIRNTIDKMKCKKILLENGISIPTFYYYGDTINKYPVIVKPVCGHGSLKITPKNIISSKRELDLFFRNNPSNEFCIEEFVPGREIHVSILNGEAVGWGEYLFGTERVPILDYEYKWIDTNLVAKRTGNKFEGAILKGCREQALWSHLAVDGTSYARVDLRVSEDEIYVIDVNPNCCLNPDSAFYKAYKSLGISYTDMIEKISIS